MFNKNINLQYKQAIEGIEVKTLVYGEKTFLSEFRLGKGENLPKHNHPHE